MLDVVVAVVVVSSFFFDLEEVVVVDSSFDLELVDDCPGGFGFRLEVEVWNVVGVLLELEVLLGVLWTSLVVEGLVVLAD